MELTGEDRQQLREGRPVFIENMVNCKGEEPVLEIIGISPADMNR